MHVTVKGGGFDEDLERWESKRYVATRARFVFEA